MSDKEQGASGKGARMSLRVKPASAAAASAEPGTESAFVEPRLQLKHILVPVDFSEPSEKALKYAARFAEQFGSKVTVLHVIQPMVYPADFGYPPTVVDTLDDAVRGQIEERLAALARMAGPDARRLVRVGQPYFEIAAAADELKVDLIIINTHGRTGLKHVFLGSTAERVVRHAPCPVLTIREREHDFV
jgi:universal stress protein A